MTRPNVFLLSVGINRYQSEQVSNLSGCENDVKALQDTLIQTQLVKQEHCKMLRSEQATRANIIHAIRTHFSQLQEGDMAVLHFSGHGSWEMTNVAFIEAGCEQEGGRNETLVCYDSHAPGSFNLADKELRWLIHEIQQSKKDTSFIGIFDCCHAGSMLKDEQWKMRSTSGNNSYRRPLAKYLEGQYQQMLTDTGRIKLPYINYLSFAACSPKERAWETNGHGLFTQALIHLLEQDPQISYAQLHTLTNVIVQQKTKREQMPYLESLGSINPHQSFLQNRFATTPAMPRLHKIDGAWTVKLGGIHGVRMPNSADDKLSIFQKNDGWHPVGQAQIKAVLAEETIITPTFTHSLSADSHLYISLYGQQLPIHINHTGQDNFLSASIRQFLQAKTEQLPFTLHPQAKYEIQTQADSLKIYRNDTQEKSLIIGLKDIKAQDQETMLAWLSHQLRIIQRWEAANQLRSPKNSTIDPALVKFNFYCKNNDQEAYATTITTDKQAANLTQRISIPLSANAKPFTYQLRVENQHPHFRGLYYYLIHLDRKYKIQQKSERYETASLQRTNPSLYDSSTEDKGLGIANSNVQEAEDIFILIASQSRLTYPQYFYQEGFAEQFGKMLSLDSWGKTKDELALNNIFQNDWIVKKIIVSLKRQ